VSTHAAHIFLGCKAALDLAASVCWFKSGHGGLGMGFMFLGFLIADLAMLAI
jgi:hypothetical protein